MGLHQQEAAQATAAREPGNHGVCPAPAITLQPLPPQDPLLAKWRLKNDLPTSTDTCWRRHGGTPNNVLGPGGHLRLCVLADGDNNEAWECRIPFAELAREGGLVLGRCPDSADISLPLQTVSRRHALLEIADNGLVITDLSSTNGTSVNEQQLTPYDRQVPLSHGASLRLGGAKLRLEYIH